MGDDIDIEEHDVLNDPALRSVFPDLVILKHEIIDFEETPIKTENELDSTFEANSGNPPLVCSTLGLDVKPDIRCTDIDDTVTVMYNLSESEIVDSHIKKESENVVSNELPFYRNRIILGKINEDVPDEEHKNDTPSNSYVFNNEYKTYSGPDIAVVIKTDEDRSKSITKQHYEIDNCLQAKVLLADCYLSLLRNKCYCAQCAILFPSTNAYSEHHISTHPDSSKSTKASAALVERKKFIRTADKRYECSTCMKTFTTSSYLSSHNLIHSSEKPFECTTCNKTFRHRKSLNRHNLIHTGEKPFECSTCMKTFTTSSSLSSHNLIHSSEKPFECTTCNKTFRHRKSLKRHNLIHTGEKPFECKTCKKTFRHRSKFNEHNFIHTGEKPFECKTCKKTFRHLNNLKAHNLIHTGEKPFECTTCNETFRQRKSLKRHNLIHTGEKECTTCKKTFGNQDNLNEHKLIHSSEKPFQCTICKKSFRVKRYLTKHQLSHWQKAIRV